RHQPQETLVGDGLGLVPRGPRTRVGGGGGAPPPPGAAPALVSRLGWIIERLGGIPTPIVLDRADRDAIAQRLADGLLGGGTPVGGLVSLLALDDTPHPDHPVLTTGLALTVTLAQALADLRIDTPLWLLTRGAVAAGEDDRITRPDQAMTWGLGRTLALESPHAWGGLIDLPADLTGGSPPDDQSLLWLGVALTGVGGEDQFAARPGGLRVPRLLPAGPPDRTTGPAAAPWRPAGTVLITGGTGAVGAHLARHLARLGARRLVLASRRGPAAPGAQALVDDLAALGTPATVEACDVADDAALTALLRRQAERGEPVTAAVHAAGVAGVTMALSRLSLAAVADVLAGKVAGAAALDRVLDTPDGATLTDVVLLSSIAGVWGSGDQAAYSAANAYLDALADPGDRRRPTARPGGPARVTTVAFGPWSDGGMGDEPALRDHLLRRGLRPLRPHLAAQALTGAVAAGETTLTVVDVDWARLLPAMTAARPARFFEALPDPASERTGAGAGAGAAPREAAELPAAATPPRGPALVALVHAQAAAILGHDTPADLDPARRFLELGFDSLASVELRRRRTAAPGLTLSPQVVFEHPTVVDLAEHLDALAAEHAAASTQPVLASPSTTTVVLAGAGAAAAQELGVGARGLYRQACLQGKFTDGVGVLRAVARLRPVFTTLAEFGAPPRPVRLATGPARLPLVCLPSMVAPSGPHNFARLALHLHGHRDVHALAHPGFGDGELLPASAELVVAMHADTIARVFAITPVVLAGYSSGGWLAHAIAAELEDRGIAPAAVVLLDTWLPTDRIPEEDIHEELRGIAVNDQAFALMTEAQVTAQGAYLDLFESWRPRPVATPVTLLRATERMPRHDTDRASTDRASTDRPGAAGTDAGPDVVAEADWDMPHDTLHVAGDHQSMMHEHAAATARDLHRWLRHREQAVPAGS
ncbi:type I polyketide synthase, partial [Frankia sp. AgB32]|uniref:type I polyketide synthase n=1 Tax=Frankia sp. AgB32 TaxID=631119 RepID=UPI00200BAA3E